jgi:iron complex outermembrane recepter protein
MRWFRILGGVLLAAFVATGALAQTRAFRVPPGELKAALDAFAKQSGVQLVYRADEVGTVQSKGVTGTLSTDEALARILEGTGFTMHRDSSGAIAIVRPKDTKPRADNQVPPNAVQLEGIVVTAQKREERAQDVPMSVAVIGNREIERRGLIGMEDYLRSIPGVTEVDRGGKQNAIVIRGITTTPEGENFESGATVGTYFDETPITGAAGRGAGGVDVRPVDIERIEVLRGPQGTAYGSASLGGTLRIIPVKPKLGDFSGRVATAYSETSGTGSENTMVQGILNIPVLKDVFALRLVGYNYDESGFYRNIAGVDPAVIAIGERFGLQDFFRGHVQDDVGRMRTRGGRAGALWQPNDRLDLSMTVLSQRIEQDGAPLTMFGTYDQSRIPIDPRGRIRDQRGEAADSKIDLANLVLNLDLGWAVSTSALSRVKSGTIYNISIGSDFTFLAPTTHQTGSDFKSFTAETRLASKLPGRVQFLAGLFYEDVEEAYFGRNDWPASPALNTFRTDPLSLERVTREYDQTAVFGELSYELIDKLTATVGARYFKYEKDEVVFREGFLFNTAIGAGTTQVMRSSEKDHSFKANLTYRPTADAMVYAGWSQGFRLGKPLPGLPPGLCDRDGDGVVDGTSITIESTRRIDSDFIDNYEVGGKFALFDRRMMFEASVYHIKWSGLPGQIQVLCPGASAALSLRDNLAEAKSDGFEFQTSLFLTKGLRLDFGAGYTRAVVSKDAATLAAPAGARLPGSPKVNGNLALQYDFQVAGQMAFVRADTSYVGKYYGNLAQTPSTLAGGYVKVDARAGITLRRDIGLELFVRNLTNEDAFTWRSASGAGSAYRLRPRTVGIQVAYSF